jgi:hypothetical protein
MNGIATFRLSTLSDEELLRKVDAMTDEMYQSQKVPTRYIPARPDDDYDILVGELIYRYKEVIDKKPATPSGDWKEEDNGPGAASEFIDRAIGMLKKQYKDEWLIAGYNGIVALLGYAKSKIERMDAERTELKSQLQEARRENEELKNKVWAFEKIVDYQEKEMKKLEAANPSRQGQEGDT